GLVAAPDLVEALVADRLRDHGRRGDRCVVVLGAIDGDELLAARGERGEHALAVGDALGARRRLLDQRAGACARERVELAFAHAAIDLVVLDLERGDEYRAPANLGGELDADRVSLVARAERLGVA